MDSETPYDLVSIEELQELLTDPKKFKKFLKNSVSSSFDVIKVTVLVLSILADLEEESPEISSFALFSQAKKLIIEMYIFPFVNLLRHKKSSNIIKEMLENNVEDAIFDEVEVLAKWWVQYLPLIYEVFTEKQEVWKAEKVELWMSKFELELLDQSLLFLEQEFHWKISVLRACCLHKQLLSPDFQYENHMNCISKYYIAKIENELSALTMSKSQSENQSKLEKNYIYREGALKILKNFLETGGALAENALLLGRISKNSVNELSHTVIIGENSGFYALLNKINEKEKDLLMESGEISLNYSNNWKISSTGRTRVIIGKGNFGTIRLCLTLTRNEHSSTLKAGQIVCVKKTSHYKKESKEGIFSFEEIRINSWNDYSCGDIGKVIFTPTVYDVKIMDSLCDSSLETKHKKGYTIQQFLAVYDGNKAFQAQEGPFSNQWSHQKSYLLDIFCSIGKLLSKGICMTDLKPENTLYDGENQRAILIDLSGVVRKKSYKDLLVCKGKYIREFTAKFSAPEINSLDDDDEIDLSKSMSYTLGMVLKEVILKQSYYQEIQASLEQLYRDLVKSDPKKRISIGEALTEFKKIISLTVSDITTPDFSQMITKIYDKTISSLEKFGLDPKLQEKLSSYIPLKCSKNFTSLTASVLQDLENEVNEFLQKREQETETVMVLLGSSGSGKSFFLQKKYLEALKSFKKGEPMPFYLNLSVEEDLKYRWKWLMDEIGEEIKFNVFSGGNYRYPVVLYIDSFDEVGSKINFIEKFFKDLANNPLNKAVICCRSEFIQKEQDFQKFFSPGNPESIVYKLCIANLDQSSFNYEDYIKDFYKEEILEEKVLEIQRKIIEKGLKNLMRTSYMLRLTLEVFPQILTCQLSITKSLIYEQFTVHTFNKVPLSYKELLMHKFNLHSDLDFQNFLKENGEILAEILHKNGCTKVDFNKAQAFFQKFSYEKHISALESQILIAVIRALDLTIEVKGVIPNEKIALGFMHDSIKNHFLTRLMARECIKDNPKPLGERLIVEDEALVNFLAEEAIQNENFARALKGIVLESKYHGSDENFLRASSNAITILIAANFSFANQDLKGIKIPKANLKDGIFNGCDLSFSDLSNSNLKNAKLNRTCLYNTNLTDVILGLGGEINVGSEISSAEYSPSGSMMICSCHDKTVKIWDSNQKSLINTLKAHKKPVNFACFSKDEALILSGSDDHKAIIWASKTGSMLKKLKCNDAVISGCFSPDGTRILTGSKDNLMRLWGKAGWQLLNTFTCHKDWVTCLSFSPDHTLIASGSMDRFLRVWSRQKNKIIFTKEAHQNGLTSLAFSPNGMWIVTGSMDATAKIWDKSDGKLLMTLKGHNDGVLTVSIGFDNETIITGSRDKILRVWSKNSGEILQSFEAHNDIITATGFRKDSNIIFSGSRDYKLKFWEINSDRALKSYEGHKKTVNSVNFNSNSEYFVTASNDHSVKIWETSKKKLRNTLEGHKSSVNYACFSPNDKIIASCSVEGELFIWSFESGVKITSFGAHLDSLNRIAFSSKEDRLLTCSKDKTIKLWTFEPDSDLYNFKQIFTFEGHQGSVNDIAYCPTENEIFASVSEDKNMILWHEQSAKILKKFEYHKSSINSVCFSSNGLLIATASNDLTANLWDRITGNLLKIFEGHQSWVLKAVFSPNNKYLATASQDKIIKLWSIPLKKKLKTLKGHVNAVTGLAFLNEDLVSCGADCTIRFWGKPMRNSSLDGELKNDCQSHNYMFRSKSKSLYAFVRDNIEIYQDTTKKLFRSIKTDVSKRISCISFSPNDQEIAFGNNYGEINIWCLQKNELLKTFKMSKKSLVTEIEFSFYNKYFLTANMENEATLWDKNSGLPIKSFNDFDLPLISFEFSKDSHLLLIETTKKILFYELPNFAAVEDHKSLTEFPGKNLVKNFQCFQIISANETAFACKGMVLVDYEGSNKLMEEILMQKGCKKFEKGSLPINSYLNQENTLVKEVKASTTDAKDKKIKTNNLCCSIF